MILQTVFCKLGIHCWVRWSHTTWRISLNKEATITHKAVKTCRFCKVEKDAKIEDSSPLPTV